MDGPTWNAYQIVGNRARAMCYATQQDQFRRLTEMAVHELVAAADDQLENLKQMMVKLEMICYICVIKSFVALKKSYIFYLIYRKISLLYLQYKFFRENLNI